MLRVLDTFAGIGGFSVGLEATGFFETVAFCEIEPYARQVLRKNFPEVPIYDDIKTLSEARLRSDGLIRGGPVDVISGGFPCQDLSNAGKRAGIDGSRSGLWEELRRCIGEFRPRFAIVENVTALLSGDRGRWFGRVLGDLAALGFDAEWYCIRAADVGAPHRRNRVWLIAYPQYSDADDSGSYRTKVELERETQFRNEQVGNARPVREGISDADGDAIRDRSKRPARRRDDVQGSGSAEPRDDGAEKSLADAEIEPERPGLCENGSASERRRRSGDGGRPVATLADSHESGLERRLREIMSQCTGERPPRPGRGSGFGGWRSEPSICRVVNGISYGLDGYNGRVAVGVPDRADRLRCLGNAIVPQIAQAIGYAIAEREGLI